MKQSFKIGDKVKIISRDKEIDDSWYIGRIGILTKIDPSERLAYHVEFPDGDDNDCEAYQLELVAEKPGCKVGDTVRVAKCRENTKKHIGITGEVVYLFHDGDVHVKAEGEDCAASEIEPVKKKVSIPDWLLPLDAAHTFDWSISKDDLFKISSEMMKPLEMSLDWGHLGSPKKPARTVMYKVKTLASKLLDSDVKALVKAGWLDDELEITDEGQEAILNHYLLAHKKELATEARAQLEAEKKASR